MTEDQKLFIIDMPQLRGQKPVKGVEFTIGTRDEERALRAELRQQIHDLAGENQRLKAEVDELRVTIHDLDNLIMIASEHATEFNHIERMADHFGYDLVKRPEVESKGEAIAKAMKK